MRRLVSLVAIVIMLGLAERADAVGRMPGDLAQFLGWGYGAGYHAPIIHPPGRVHWHHRHGPAGPWRGGPPLLGPSVLSPYAMGPYPQPGMLYGPHHLMPLFPVLPAGSPPAGELLEPPNDDFSNSMPPGDQGTAPGE